MEHLLIDRVGEREALDDAIGQRGEAARDDELRRRTSAPHSSSTSTSSRSSAAATAVDGNSRPARLAASSSRCSSGASRSICFSTISRRLSGTPVSISSRPTASAHAPVVGAAQMLAVDQVGEHRDQKQRVAVGPLVQQVDQLRRQAVRAEPGVEERADGGLAQQVERQLAAEPVYLQVLLHRPQRMPIEDDVAGAIGADDQHARRLAAASQRRDEVDGGAVAPVQILEDEHERLLRAQRLDGLGHLAQHALAGRAAHLGFERGAVARLHDRRHLPQPGGGVAAQQRRPAPTGAARAAAGRTRRETAGTASEVPESSRHCPRAAIAAPPRPVSSRKASTTVVLPMPGSPVTKTVWRSPAIASARWSRRRSSVSARPTSGLAPAASLDRRRAARAR